jgi:dUTP pyrophosphatase
MNSSEALALIKANPNTDKRKELIKLLNPRDKQKYIIWANSLEIEYEPEVVESHFSGNIDDIPWLNSHRVAEVNPDMMFEESNMKFDPSNFKSEESNMKSEESDFASEMNGVDENSHKYEIDENSHQEIDENSHKYEIDESSHQFQRMFEAFGSMLNGISEDEAVDELPKMEARSDPPLKRGTAYSAGHDICTPYAFTIFAGRDRLVDTGVKLELLDNQYAKVESRSGLGFRYNIEPFNGIIDSDYKDTVKILLRNRGTADYKFEAGERIAQLIISKYVALTNAEILSTGPHTGFGSTGK